ncbi:hypothetical protein CIY_27490 [Butyrivibrio fibrisolvens 16/4]|nr:hypothetical protein CIY_27490 [Butyrivibrio fibrisolvens 16/4]
MFKLDFSDKKKVINRVVPLLIYIVCGITVVFAPGNFVRQGGYDVNPSIPAAVKQIIIDIIVRLKDIAFHHPLAIAIFFILVFVGIKAGTGVNRNNILVTIFLTVLCIFGTLFPYVYGRAMTTTYLDVRMQYLLDYELLIGICIGCLQIGMILAARNIENLSRPLKISVTVAVLAIVGVLSLHGKTYQKIVPIDIVRNSGLIKESYAFWNGIILEIESSPKDEVIITRDEEPSWTPYFLYSGLPDGYLFEVKPEAVYSSESIMPNVYYQKKSILYRLKEK